MENQEIFATLDDLLAQGENPDATALWDTLTPETQEEYFEHYHDGCTDFSAWDDYVDGIPPTFEEAKAAVLYLINAAR